MRNVRFPVALATMVACALLATGGCALFNKVPTASDVALDGTLVVGSELAASYLFADEDGDVEGSSTFAWYRADDADGTGAAAISGATAASYTLTADDVGCHLAVEVTPVAAEGKADGEAVLSAYTAVAVISAEMEERGYWVMFQAYYGCAVAVALENWDGDMTNGDVEGLTVTDTAYTLAFVDAPYDETVDVDATMSGSFVMDVGDAVGYGGEITCVNDDLAVAAVAADIGVTVDAETEDQVWSGSVTINGVEVGTDAFKAYVDAAMSG